MIEAEASAIQDWVTIWHSEWAALALDREQQEAALRGIDAIGGTWAMVAAMVAAMLAATPPKAGTDAARADAAARPTPADAASDARVVESDARVVELERRVAELEARLDSC